MRRFAAAVLLLLAACSSTAQRNAPPIALELGIINPPTNLLYFAGPVNLQFQVTLSNPTDETVTLRRLDIRTLGGSLYLRAPTTPYNVEVKPHASATATLTAWGSSRGGHLAADEPIHFQVTAYFDSPKGPFVRLMNTAITLQ
jgi:hypothetical protein